MKKLYILFILFGLMVASGYTQDTTIHAYHEYFEYNKGSMNRIRILDDTSYIAFGILKNSGSIGGSVVSKFSENDSLLWQNIYDTFGGNYAFTDAVFQDGTVYCIINNVFDQLDPPIILAAYREDGSVRFEKPVLDSLDNLQYLRQIKTKGNRLYAIALNRSNAPLPPLDIFTFIKLKPSGQIEAKYDFPLPNASFGPFTDVFLMEDSVICRTSFSLNGLLDLVYYASFIFDYNTNLLNYHLSTTPAYISRSVRYDAHGNGYVIKGSSPQDINIVKALPDLSEDTIYKFGLEIGYLSSDLDIVLNDVGVEYIIYAERNLSDTTSRAFVIKLDGLGNGLWKTQVPVSSTLVPTYPLMMEKGVIFDGGLVGYIDLFDLNNNAEPYLFQITADGTKFFSWKIDLASDKSITNDIAIDQRNHVILAGERQSPNLSDSIGMFVAKIDPPLFVQTSNSSEQPIQKPLTTLKINPNPIEDVANIWIERSKEKPEKVQLSFIDVQGKAVFTQNYSLRQAEEQISIKSAGFPSGVYWVLVQGADWSVAEKVVVK